MASEASGMMSGMMDAMIPVMITATEDQAKMSMVQSVLNIAKTAANDIEDDSKKQ